MKLTHSLGLDEDGNFHVVLTPDEAASLVDDICLLADFCEEKDHEDGFCIFSWEFAQQANRLWRFAHGCNIVERMDDYEGD